MNDGYVNNVYEISIEDIKKYTSFEGGAETCEELSINKPTIFKVLNDNNESIINIDDYKVITVDNDYENNSINFIIDNANKKIYLTNTSIYDNEGEYVAQGDFFPYRKEDILSNLKLGSNIFKTIMNSIKKEEKKKKTLKDSKKPNINLNTESL